MPANVELDQTTIQTQNNNYKNTALYTENGGDSSRFGVFTYAGTGKPGDASTYSFGLFQFDVGNNPNVAQPALAAMGFNQDDITNLSKHGTLDQATLNGLNTKLADALATPEGQTAYNNAINETLADYAKAVQTDVNDASTTIRGEILSDPVAVQRLYDLNNQFGTATLSALQGFVGGDLVTPGTLKNPGSPIQWDYKTTAQQNLSNFLFATPFGAANGAVTRDNAFDKAVAGETMPLNTINISGNTGSDAGSDPGVATFPTLQNTRVNLDNGTSVHVLGASDNNQYQCGITASGAANLERVSGPNASTVSCTVSSNGVGTFSVNAPGDTVSVGAGGVGTVAGDGNTTTLASNPLTPSAASAVTDTGNNATANVGADDAIIMTGTGGTVNASSFGNLITQTGGTLNFGANSYANKVFGDTNIASLTSGDYANFFGNGQTLNLNGDYVLGGASNSVFNIASGTNALIGGDGSIVNAAAGTNSLRFGGDQYLINANAVPIFLADSNTGRLNGTGLAVTTDNQNLTFGSTSANTTVFGSNNFAQTTAPFDFNSIIFDPSGTSNTSVWNGGALGSSVSQTSGFDPNTLNSYQLWSNPNAQGTLYEALSNNTFGGSTNIFTPAAFVDPTYGTETTNNTGQNFSGSVTTDNFLLGGMYAGQQMNFGYNYDPNSVFQGFNLNYNFGDGSSQVASFDPFGNWTAGATDLSAYGGYGLDGYNSGWNNSGSAATSPPGAAAAAAAASAKALATAIAAERSLSAASSSPSKTHAMIGAFHGHKAKLTNVVKRSKTHFSAKTHNAILAKAKALVAKAPPVSKFNAVGGGKGAQFAQEITTTQLKPHAAPITSPLAIAAHLAQAMATFDATTGSLDHVMLHTQDFRDRGTFASAHGMRMAAL